MPVRCDLLPNQHNVEMLSLSHQNSCGGHRPFARFPTSRLDTLKFLLLEPLLVLATSLFWLFVLPLAGLFWLGASAFQQLEPFSARAVDTSHRYRSWHARLAASPLA